MKAIPLGQCFSWAFRQAVKENVIVYHGLVTEPFTDNTYPHAWIEKNGLIQDWQTMEAGSSKFAGVGWDKALFHETFKPTQIKEYSSSRLIHLVATYNHMGPYVE